MAALSYRHRLRSFCWRWLRRMCVAAAALFLLLAALWFWFHPDLKAVVLYVANRFSPELLVEADAISRDGDLWQAHGLRFSTRADHTEVLRLNAFQFRASLGDLRGRHLREVIFEVPDLHLPPGFFKGQSTRTTTNQPAKPSAPWRIDRLQITGGRFAMRLPNGTAVETGVEASLSALSFTAGAIDDAVTQKIQLHDLRILGADPAAAPALRLGIAEAEFTWREVLERKRIAQLRIERSEIGYDAAAQQLMPERKSDSQNNSASASEPPWRIGRLDVAGGRMRLEDLGAGLPRFTFAMDASLKEVAIGGNLGNEESEVQTVTIRGLEARAPTGDGEPFLRAPVVNARFTWRDVLHEHRFGSLEIPRLTLNYSAEVQRAFATTSASEAAAPIYRIGNLKIEEAAVKIDSLQAGAPLSAFTFTAALSEVPLGSSTEPLSDAAQTLGIRDVELRIPGRTEPFLSVPAIASRFSWRGFLQEKRIGSLRIERPALQYDPAVRRALAADDEEHQAETSAAAKPASQQPYRVGELELIAGKVRLVDLGIGVPPIEFGVATSFKDMALSLEGEAWHDTLQTIELHDIALQSPVDPFVSVLNLRTLFIRFTPAGLWKRQIEQVEIINPVLNVGEDLFWYVDRVQQSDAPAATERPAATAAPDRGWTVKRFDVTSGQLVLAFDGRPKLPLPLPFETHASELNFQRLRELRLTLDLVVPKQDYMYPDYNLTLRGVSGHLQFSLPPEQRANNLVHTLQIEQAQWKDYRARDLFLDVTFMEKAVHGDLGGGAYSGYVRGAFDFSVESGSAWNGWISGTKVDLKRITDAFSPEKVSLSGPADFRATVTARAKEIDRFEGDFTGQGAGHLQIAKLDEIIRDLPPEWAQLKRQLTRIGLEAFRDFDYDTANGNFRFLGRAGRTTLDFRGPRGSRRFEALFHDERSAAEKRGDTAVTAR